MIVKPRTLGPILLACLLGPTALSAAPPADTPATATPEPTPAISHDAENAVVKVFATLRRPDLLRQQTGHPTDAPA